MPLTKRLFFVIIILLMFKKLLAFINQPTKFGEILRFVIVGGLATVIDFLAMGITLYLFEPSLYPNFYNVFFGAIGEPSTLAASFGTGLGFLFGLLANYLLSILFVFNEKGKSKTLKGFLVFTFFSAIGLLIHEIGMLVFFGELKINEWVVKIVMTLIVLVYNYITRKLFIFKKDKNSTSKDLNETLNTEAENEN